MASDDVAALLLGLVDTLLENTKQDPIDFLILGCSRLPAVERVGVVLTDPRGEPIAAHGSDDDVRRLVERRDGPALDCVRSTRPAVVGSVCAIPLVCEDQTLGALAIVVHTPPAGEPLVRIGQTLADAAAKVMVIRREADRNRVVVNQLQTALTSRIGIEQAKGMMAGKLGVGVDEAFQILRDYARSHNRRLAEVAAEVMSGQADPGDIRGRVVSRQRGARTPG